MAKLYDWLMHDIIIIIIIMMMMMMMIIIIIITSRWIDISCGFLQGESYSPVCFCISEIAVCLLLQQSKGYRMGQPGCRDIN